MKHKIILLILIALNLNAQIQSFEITYDVLFEKSESLKVIKNNSENNSDYDPTVSIALADALEFIAKNSKIKLVMDNEKSISYYEQMVVSDALEKNQKILIEAIVGQVYFHDCTNKKSYQNSSFNGKKFNVVLPTKNWKITNETKMIGNFLCYKIIDINDSRNESWFTYEIPNCSGPMQNFGAPGLILESKSLHLTYRASQINFKNVKTDKVKMPKGEIVTKQEMNKIGQKARQAQYGRQ
jgi:GLPGLI family protein